MSLAKELGQRQTPFGQACRPSSAPAPPCAPSLSPKFQSNRPQPCSINPVNACDQVAKPVKAVSDVGLQHFGVVALGRQRISFGRPLEEVPHGVEPNLGRQRSCRRVRVQQDRKHALGKLYSYLTVEVEKSLNRLNAAQSRSTRRCRPADAREPTRGRRTHCRASSPRPCFARCPQLGKSRAMAAFLSSLSCNFSRSESLNPKP